MRQFKFSLLQKLSQYGIAESDLDGFDLVNESESEIFKAIIPLFINRLDELSKIANLYFQIALERESKADENSYGCRHNYWDAIFDYIITLSMEIKRITSYRKAKIKYYEVYVILRDDSPIIDKYFNKRIISTEEALNSIKKLLSIKTKEDLHKYRPLLFFNERATADFYFPPFYLGCIATTVMSYKI